ncbi:NfeD family protein [Cupriavidus agavae]|uniref:Membrane protein implicated in regulation of membrane protease activity n=1 Tax=Cupriavidus agavae TaxID=1001822 RepID=A0A4Q7S6L5_9BURK|nr:NfeD family protein [Cupriavidus agavae]RZT42016.1 membrane protein implicated in regulation of membrane protease activity [Cupriavidus agavae]
MTSYYLWFAAAVVLIIAEMATGTFYLLMIAAGVAAGGLAALVGLDVPFQTLAAAIVAIIAIAALRRTRYGKLRRKDAGTDPDVNLDIGQELDVAAWDGFGRARVPYRGADWTVELLPGMDRAPGRFRIVEVRGTTLIVSPR